jgi:hypothetical protein
MNELRAAAPGWGVEALMQGQVIEVGGREWENAVSDLIVITHLYAQMETISRFGRISDALRHRSRSRQRDLLQAILLLEYL